MALELNIELVPKLYAFLSYEKGYNLVKAALPAAYFILSKNFILCILFVL